MKFIYTADNGKYLQTFISKWCNLPVFTNEVPIDGKILLFLYLLFLSFKSGWLRKDDMQLKVTAGLAIGNFACNDEHTTQLMENKTSVTLIGLLKQHQNVNGDLKLQHALLGTVRNLAVNAAARKQLLEQGNFKELE